MEDVWYNLVKKWNSFINTARLILAVIVYIFLGIFILAIISYLVWLFAHHSWLWALLAFVIVGIPLLFWFLFKSSVWKRLHDERVNARILEEALENGEISHYIRNALLAMDSTHKWYADENEANRELVTSLKSQGLEAEYQPRLAGGSTADAKVGKIVIEGKLSPHKADIDRLLGQLIEYTKYNDKVCIVIYGKLHEYTKSRITEEIEQRYLINRVFLSYLKNPNRDRHR